MAQYYQLLSQGTANKSTVEELKQYYPNLIEANQTVQYVINPEDQQFQGQQILVSSDQLMVIDNSQHVIVDQSPLTYQSQQFIVQDNSSEYQDGVQQQIYYMEEVDSDRITTEPQPIVLNHQLQASTPVRTQVNMNSVEKASPNRQQQILQMQQQNSQTESPTVRQIVQTPRTPQHIQHQQPHILQHRNPTVAHLARQQLQQNNPQTRNEQVPHQTLLQKLPNQGTSRGNSAINQIPPEVPPLHFTQPEIIPSEIVDSDDHEAVALADGRIMGKAAYKQMIADSKRASSMLATNQQKQSVVPPLTKFCIEHPKSKGRASNRGGRGRRNNNIASRINSHPLQFSFQNNSRFSNQQQQQIRPVNQLKSNIPQPVQFNVQHQPQAQQHLLHSNRQQQSYKQPQYIIQPPSQHHQHASCPLPSYVASSQIQQIIENTPISEEYSDSIRMLVLLEDGEQRLITFTLPKEQCTIQEILEQVSVPFRPDTKIECTETNHAGINYLVTVGACHSEKTVSKEDEELEDVNIQNSSQKSEEVIPPPSPEPPVEVEQPKYIPGLLAVCNHCGITSENLARCSRCAIKFPEDVKTISTTDANINNGKKSDMLQALQVAHDKKFAKESGGNTKVPNGGPSRRKKSKLVDPDPVILTLSSDEDEESLQSSQSETQQLLKKLSSSVTLSAIKKEPSASDIQQIPVAEVESTAAVRGGGKEDSFDMVDNSEVSTSLYCRTIRIGSYRYIPKEHLVIKAKGIVLKVPSPQDPNDIKTIVIERKHMIKVLANFQKALPVIFYYVNPVISQTIRDQLGMVEGSEIYFDPLSKEETHKRITILPEIVNEEMKVVFKHIYSKPNSIMEELTTKEANDILVKTCPKEISKVVLNAGYQEIRTILIYPPGKGGISINTEDYLCLAQDQFLNDVIIDFYLKYLVLNLPQEMQDKVHVFSTFFYKRLTTKPLKPNRKSHPAEVDATLTPAQKRHARVEKWTKNVNLFEKDYIIIPINESSHWFLAIVCFPGMEGCLTFDGKPVSLEPIKRKKPSIVSSLGNHISITPIKKEKEEKAIPCEDDDVSDKDEAEGDDSELESDSEEAEVPEPQPVQSPKIRRQNQPPIKQACILIFDSLAGASRCRVVATLRDYLTCEYKAKMGKEKIFNKDVIKGAIPKIPQQTNFTDCGLYLLQYVEQFFEDPISDYRTPMKILKDWFDEFVVTKKREDISNLIMDLMIKNNRDPSLLPDIVFPTLNGKLVVHNPEDDEDEFMDDFADEEEEDEDEESFLDSSDVVDGSLNSESYNDSDAIDNGGPSTSNPIKINLNPSSQLMKELDKKVQENNKQCTNSFVVQSASFKADTSEIQKQSSRETLSYLKSKRINRHKSNDKSDLKKFKPSFE